MEELLTPYYQSQQDTVPCFDTPAILLIKNGAYLCLPVADAKIRVHVNVLVSKKNETKIIRRTVRIRVFRVPWSQCGFAARARLPTTAQPS